MATLAERFTRSSYRIVAFPAGFAAALIAVGVVFDFLLGWDTAGGVVVAISTFFVLLAVLTALLLVYLNEMDFRE